MTLASQGEERQEASEDHKDYLEHSTKFVWVFSIFVALIAAGQLFAWLFGVSPEEACQTGYAKHTVVFWQMVTAIWAATFLATVALSRYVSTPSEKIDEWWRLFYTFAYFALLIHLYWAIAVNADWNFDEIFNSPKGVGKPEHVVDHPILDLALAIFWGLDVLLAWLSKPETKFWRWYRGALHIAVFAMFSSAGIETNTDPGIARRLGFGLVALVCGAALVDFIRKEVDEKSLVWACFVQFFYLFNRYVAPWTSLPTFLAVPNLIAVRARLRERNLHGVAHIEISNDEGLRKIEDERPAFRIERQVDGFYNDPHTPTMGCASENTREPHSPSDFDKSHPGARFGRNVPLTEAHPELDAPLLDPNPRLVSNLLLARPIENDEPKVTPATTLNLLAAAWIQFQTHDWFSHGTPRKIDDDPIEVLVDPADWPEAPMQVRRTRPDPTRDPSSVGPNAPPTYVCAESHWWDGSQIYGGNSELLKKYRAHADGKLKIDPETYRLPIEEAETGALPQSWWVGLGLMHVLFTLEHNAICDHLRQRFPEWRKLPKEGDEQIFRIARLVNSALMAKIHTVEWTPAILDHPALRFSMRASWWGIAQEFITSNLGRIGEGEIVSGIPGSRKNHHGVDFSLTEEFVSVYRMHPLLPETLTLRSHKNDDHLHTMTFEDDDDPHDLARGPNSMPNASRHAHFADLFYSFGMANPGALTLRNFPKWMRRMKRPHETDEMIDLAAIDILRDRERGVPRYNRFRRLFDLPRKTMKEIANGDEQLLEALQSVYGRNPADADKVDLMVGLFSETPPAGFGFSDTAFRVFVLMASRRLKSDRLFTDDYRPEIYTQTGLDWINDNTMNTVLLRHFPDLTHVLRGVENPFAPWHKKRKLEDETVEVFREEARRRENWLAG